MFVLLNPTVKPPPVSDDLFQLNEDFRLPRSCKTVVLNLQNISDSIKTNCCDHLVVYDDTDLLADYDNLKVTDDELAPADKINAADVRSEHYSRDVNESVWYNSTVFVRGFKDVLVRGKSIWNR